ncbi:MAG TPA: SNF2-related protein [Bacillota bacterium]
MPLQCWPEVERRWREAGVSVYGYQLATAERVVEVMGGRAILADEVGLGKTIEAGLIICELMHRGLVKSVLILTPASLTGQWATELREKFGLSFLVNPERLAAYDQVIASLDVAKRDAHRQALCARRFDLVIVDEAHKLKNRRTLNYQLVRELKTHYLILLSATPLQNDLTELYSLVSLVKPNLFGSFNEFWRQFLIDKRTPKNPEQLRQLLANVMIRHRRQNLELVLPEREVSLIPLRLFPDERELYDRLTETLRREYESRREASGAILPLITLQREVCSSSRAVAATLARICAGEHGAAFREVLELARQVRHNRKAHTLMGLVAELGEKVIVFTEFRATQEYLAECLREAGIAVVRFHGEQSSWEKEQAIRRFRREGQVLISTECGGHGLNLQFCRNLINYDLPWNPMRVEQRIGRVHRLGQEAGSVRIFNLCAQGTIEEYILELLDEKINLFRQVIGELDIILRHLERRRGVETRIAEIALSSRSDDELRRRFDQLGAELLSYARRTARTVSALPT